MPTDGVKKKKNLLNILDGKGTTSVRAGRGLTAHSVHPREYGPTHGDPARS